MPLLKSGNPTLSEKIFNTSVYDQQQGIMTARGTMNKFGFLFLMVIAGAGFTWHLYYQGKSQTMMPLMLLGVFGGLITAHDLGTACRSESDQSLTIPLHLQRS